MKAISKILLLLTLAASTVACSDFLDKDPTDRLSPTSFWKTKADIDYVLTALYATFQTGIYSYGAPNMDNITDNGYGQHNYDNSKSIVEGNISSTTGGFISTIYSTSYQAIARVNIFLKNLDAYSGADVNDALRKKYMAEAKFVRSFFYFQLYMAYGDVPIVLEPLDMETQFKEKSPRTEVYAQVVKDLDEAISNLDDGNYLAAKGHAVKSSAQALKLRVLLYDAYTGKNQINAAQMTEARNLASTIINDKRYRLDSDYDNVFKDATQAVSPEVIFSINFLAPDNATSMDQWYGDWIVVSPLKNLIDAYECKDGLDYGVSPLTNLTDPFKDRDPRLNKTIFNDFIDWGGGKIYRPSNNRPNGFGLKKFLTPELIPYGYSTRSQQDWVLLRYADVLLMFAEADNELNGPTSDVYKYMNEIRNRADMPELPVGLNKEQMRERIRKERRVELAFEGLRYYDLKRWKIAAEVLNNVKDGLIPYHFEDKFYQWPLPQEEIDKSRGKLVQNSDYN